MVSIKFGIELECGVKSRQSLKPVLPEGWQTSGDGSIDCENSIPVEIKSKPTEDRKKLVEDFKGISKIIEEINDSMGLHIHASFRSKYIFSILCSYDFVEFFQKSYAKRFKNKEREMERVDNEYCRFYDDKYEFEDARNDQTSSGYKCDANRNFSINFNSYKKFKTIEFRIFPSTKSAWVFKSYIIFLNKTIQVFLKDVLKELKEA